MKKTLLLSVALLGLASAQATADYSKVPNIYNEKVTLNADASYDRIQEETRIIRDQDDLQYGTTIALRYISSLQSAEALEAYVLKADGQKIPVGKEQITVKDAPGTGGYADFGDNKLLQVLFPNVSVGDKLYAKIHLHSQALFPGRFSVLSESQPLGYPYQSTLTIDAPQSLKLVGKARGAVKLTQQTNGERVTFVMTDGHENYVPNEPNQECPCDYDGAASVSNYTDWADMARAYRDRAADKAVVTPEISDLAKQLVGDKKGLEAVRAVDLWVRTNVRYVQVYLDAGGYVPHTAQSILKNKYGDCKDYVTLTQTLLKAVGIDSEPALIGTMPRFQELPLPGPQQFNHAILYIPSLKLFLDPTNRFAPLGAYQAPLADKPVLLTTSGVLQKFQAGNAEANAYNQQTELTLLADGTIEGKTTSQSTGSQSSDIRGAFSGVTPEQSAQIVQGNLTRRNEPGTGTLTFAPIFSAGDVADYTVTWKSPKLINMDDVTSFKMPVGYTVYDITNVLALVNTETRLSPLVFSAKNMHKTFKLTLPNGYKVSRLPKDVVGETPTLKYKVTFKQDGNVITSDQLLTFKTGIVQPADYVNFKDTLTAAVKATQGSILLEKN